MFMSSGEHGMEENILFLGLFSRYIPPNHAPWYESNCPVGPITVGFL
jgi:hypothetical protein